MSERVNRGKSEKKSDTESLNEVSEKQKELLRSKLEQAEQRHQERHSEQEVLSEATDLAQSTETVKEHARSESPAERRKGAPSKKQLNNSYKAQLKDVQSDLGPGSKLFSKFIHAAPIEKASDFISSTIASPNAMLYGSITAFIAVTILYFVARHYGYQLSGFETIAAFAIGWLLGLFYDYLSSLLRRKP